VTSSLTALGSRFRPASLSPLQISLLAYVLIAAVFVFDLVTPQALDAAVMYCIPILVAGFSPDERLTHRLVKITILADELGATSDAAFDGNWNMIGLENRFLSLIALAVVAILTLQVQKAAARLGSLSAIEIQRRRHAALSQAADHILASLGNGRLDAAIVEEAARVLEQPGVVWCPAGERDTCWVFEDGAARSTSRSDLPVRLAAVAVAAPDTHGPEVLRLPDAAAHRGDDETDDVISIPIADKDGFMGVLVAPIDDSSKAPGLVVTAASFANLVVSSLQQVRLIVDLAKQNHRLSEKQGVIQGLIDAISHDLRTPLAALSVTLKQAGDGAYGELPAEYVGVLRESKNSIDEIGNLAETLLLVARLESGGLREVRSRVRLDAIVRELAAEFSAMASSRGIDIVTRGSDDAVALGARGDVRRAIANLFANAITHTPSGGTVEVCARRGPRSVEVTVVDDGYGIDEEYRASLFERFSRAAQAGTGTGLGLHIVRRVAEEMGGSVRYEPRAPRGSCFTLSFPVAA
jgi:signal transduction histidine kinase